MQNTPRGAPADREEGYARVASWIAQDPDSETFVFRKFSKLTARNLLYLQAEITILENRLEAMETRNAASDDMNIRCAEKDWSSFAFYAAHSPELKLSGKMELVIELRVKLKEYHEALMLQSQISQLHTPSSRVLAVFRSWLGYLSNGCSRQNCPLQGSDMRFLRNPSDLVALRTPNSQDPLSRFLQANWAFSGASSELSSSAPTSIYHESHIERTVAVISGLVAAVLLVGAITSLYFAKGSGLRLGLIALFTAAFAASVGLLTNARRPEVFASTAAYAAVLVVFVSGNLGS